MARLHHLESGRTIELESYQMIQVEQGSGTSHCSFFVREASGIVFGDRYALEIDDQSFVVVPKEGHLREPGRTQVLAVVLE